MWDRMDHEFACGTEIDSGFACGTGTDSYGWGQPAVE